MVHHRPSEGVDQGEGVPGGSGRARGASSLRSWSPGASPFFDSGTPKNWPERVKEKQNGVELDWTDWDDIKLCHWFPKFPFLSLLSNLI